jgi:hypothetical protein
VITRGLVAALLLQGPAEAGQPEEPPASASEPNADQADERVLIRVVPVDEQVTARLKAELGLLGFTAVTLEVSEQTPALGSDLLDQLDDGNASAAIEIVRGEHRIDLWVADGNTGKALNRRLDLTLDPAQAEPRTVAIAAVELLRASRLELGEERGNEASNDTGDELPEQAREGERPPRDITVPSVGAFSLAPMIGGSPGGFGVTTHIELAGRWAPLERFALRFAVWIPTLGNSIGVSEGRVRMFVGMAFVEPQLRLPGGAKWFHPELGLGLGGAVVGFEGIAQEGLRSDTDIVGGFASHVHLGLGFAVIPRLWIRLDGYVGALLPRPNVKSTANVTEATWGTPYATGSLGLEIWL